MQNDASQGHTGVPERDPRVCLNGRKTPHGNKLPDYLREWVRRELMSVGVTGNEELQARSSRFVTEMMGAVRITLAREMTASAERAVRNAPWKSAGERCESLLFDAGRRLVSMEKVLRDMADARRIDPEVDASEGQRVFALLRKLRDEAGTTKAPLATVFDLLVMEGITMRQAAERCGCSTSLIARRAAKLEKVFGLRVKALRNLATQMLELETSVKGDKHRRNATRD
jgi:hypothetical protein